MATTKTNKIVYWVSTGIIVIFDGLIPALTSNTEVAVEGIRHLGYPDYFRTMLTVFKVAGALALVLPFVSKRVKEWAYAGFGLSMIAAFFSLLATDGLSGLTFFPLIVFAILCVSYIYYHKVQSAVTSKQQSHVVPGLSY